MQLKVGDIAPNFKLYSSEKKEVALADFAGKKVVLLFFPQAFTSVCTKEMCTMRDDLHYFNDLNAEILAISVDSIFTLAKFKESENLNFTLLSDFNKEVSGQYGALYTEFVFGMKGVSRRAAFVLDENGRIQYAEVLEAAGDMPNLEAIRQAVSL